MPKVTDFRQLPFDTGAITAGGKYIGRKTYWKLYAIENIFRIVIHSILSVQIPKPDNWWDVAVDDAIKQKAERFKMSYLRKTWHGKPGAHDIYYIDLKDLNEIIRANANLFDPVIPNLDHWMLGIEDLRLPRNVIAHMNFPTANDVKRIDVFYEDCLKLMSLVETKLSLLIP